MDCVLGEDIMEWLTDQGDIDTILAAALEQYETTAEVDVDGAGYSHAPVRQTTNTQANILNTSPGSFHFTACSSISITINHNT